MAIPRRRLIFGALAAGAFGTVALARNYLARAVKSLPGVMPLYSSELMIGLGLLPASHGETLVAIRRHNPLLYDFVLKRHPRSQGQGFSAATFEARRHFTKI